MTLPQGTIGVSYDGAGRTGTISAPGGIGTTFGYDGHLVTSMTTTGAVPGSVTFNYDDVFALTGRTVSGSSFVGYGYDDDGLLTQAGALSLVRDATTGFLTSTSLGLTADGRTHTTFGELDGFSGSTNGSPAYSFDLDRDVSGRITKKTETVQGTTAVWEYGYHPDRGWLMSVKKDGVVVESYGYDGNGNRTSYSDVWGTGNATYDAQDRLLTHGARSYSYTPNGELSTRTAGADVTSYEYDVRGALLGVDLPTGIQVDYLVDAGGRRIGKKVNGVLVRGFLYAGGLAPVAELDGAGQIVASFVYATKGNVPDYLVKSGTTYRIFTDHLGSVRLVIDTATGTVAQRIDYDPWGRVMLDTNPGFQPFGFAGGLYDPQTGLTRFGARDYDPEIGRWTSKDPVGFGGGSALLYEYCSNDPVNRIDRSGLANEYLEDDASFNMIDHFYLGGFFHSKAWRFIEGLLDWGSPVPMPEPGVGVVRPGGAPYVAGAVAGLMFDPGGAAKGTAVRGTVTAAEKIAVIGRRWDTDVARNWAKHLILDLPAAEWSIRRNSEWIASIIKNRQSVYVASLTTWENLWDTANKRPTVFGRELRQLLEAGYTWEGWLLVPPKM